MRTLILVFFVCTLLGIGVHGILPEGVRRDLFSIYKGTAVSIKTVTNSHVTIDQVTFTLFTKRGAANGTVITNANLDVISRKKNIVFIIHGWTHQGDLPWVLDMKNAFLQTYPETSVITVDWRKPARQEYSISAINTEDVGGFVGQMVLDLVKDYNVSIKKFLCVGHSLGGQICGFAGRKVQAGGRLLPRIFALDPAGPLFTGRPLDHRLNPADAEFVEVLHSDGGVFGYKQPCGTIDFFPNGGSAQPGCYTIDLADLTTLADPLSCDHERSFAYFTEAILRPTDFEARLCTTYNMFKKTCDKSVKVSLGDLTTTLKGNFYFETNKRSPFSKNEETRGVFGTFSNILKQ